MLLHRLARLEASTSQSLFRLQPPIGSRFYALRVKQPAATGKEASPFTYSPRAVRVRRHRFGTGDVVEVDGVKMSDSDRRRWEWLQKEGKIRKGITARDWIRERYAWRNRVRGIKYSRPRPTAPPPKQDRKPGESPTEEELQRSLTLEPKEIVGHRIYLPNFIVRLVRNSTPPGRPYDPYIATFRIPRSLTKMDIKSYLQAVYGVETTFVRTENFVSAIVRNPWNRQKFRPSSRTYKRAVVGLVDPFYYPDAKEDMTTEERADREMWEEDNFQKKFVQQLRKDYEAKQRGHKKSKGDESDSRKKIISEIMRRRAERQGVVLDMVPSGGDAVVASP